MLKYYLKKKKDGMYKGHTQNYIMVYCQSKEKLDNKIIDVVCEKAEKKTYYCYYGIM